MKRPAKFPRALPPEMIERLGLERSEEWDYRNIRSKGFSAKEAVDIIKRSRRKAA